MLLAVANEQLQNRLTEVKDELADAHETIDTYGPVVTQNEHHKDEISDLRAYALSLGGSHDEIERIKLKHQHRRGSAAGAHAPRAADLLSASSSPSAMSCRRWQLAAAKLRVGDAARAAAARAAAAVPLPERVQVVHSPPASPRSGCAPCARCMCACCACRML